MEWIAVQTYQCEMSCYSNDAMYSLVTSLIHILMPMLNYTKDESQINQLFDVQAKRGYEIKQEKKCMNCIHIYEYELTNKCDKFFTPK